MSHVSTHEKKKQQDQHREHSCNRPLTLIIIINIFEYLALSTTLYPLTSIIPYKKRVSSLQYSVFYKSHFMINLKILQIRPLFQTFRRDLILRISAGPIFCGIKFRGNLWIWPKNTKSTKFNPSKVFIHIHLIWSCHESDLFYKIFCFLGGAPTSICHFFRPSVPLLRTISQELYIISS